MALVTRVNVIRGKYDLLARACCCVVTSACFTSYSPLSSKKLTREERYMKKLYEGLNHNKKRKDPHPLKWSFGSSDGVAKITVSAGMIKRANQLSAVIHENIFYIFHYEDICPDLLKYNFEISKVKITPDLNNLNVYWNATGNKQTDDEIEHLLKESRGKLRSALTKKRIVNRIPPVQFVKDVKTAYAKQVDELMMKADMGPECTPEKGGDAPKSPPGIDFGTSKSSVRYTDASIRRLSETFQSAKYSLKDGPGARLVMSGDDDFGASSCYFSAYDKMPAGMHAGLTRDASPVDECSSMASSEPSQDDELNLRLRNDVYNLDHATLLLQVLRMKRRLQERGRLPETETPRRKDLLRLRARQLHSDDMDSKKIHKLLKETTRRRKREMIACDDSAMREEWLKEQMDINKKLFDEGGTEWYGDDDDDVWEESDYIYSREKEK